MSEIKKNSTNPWEERGQIGTLKSLWATFKKVLIKPEEFFLKVNINAHYKESYLFYLYIVLPVVLISSLIALFTNQDVKITTYLLRFLMAAVGPIIGTAIMHPFVLLLKGQEGFKGTFNVVAYGYGATSIFKIIPFSGGQIVEGIWALLIVIAGYKSIHKFKTGQAVVAYFLPAAVIVLLYMLFR